MSLPNKLSKNKYFLVNNRILLWCPEVGFAKKVLKGRYFKNLYFYRLQLVGYIPGEDFFYP